MNALISFLLIFLPVVSYSQIPVDTSHIKSKFKDYIIKSQGEYNGIKFKSVAFIEKYDTRKRKEELVNIKEKQKLQERKLPKLTRLVKADISSFKNSSLCFNDIDMSSNFMTIANGYQKKYTDIVIKRSALSLKYKTFLEDSTLIAESKDTSFYVSKIYLQHYEKGKRNDFSWTMLHDSVYNQISYTGFKDYHLLIGGKTYDIEKAIRRQIDYYKNLYSVDSVLYRTNVVILEFTRTCGKRK